MNNNKKNQSAEYLDDLDNICENCRNEDETVSQNLIMTGFKFCESCRVSKTLFPIQIAFETGKEFILLITNETDKNRIIKNDKKTIPKDLKLDFKFKICLVAIIKEAKIQNCVRKITGITSSGVTAKNLIKPGEWAYPTAIKTFLKLTLLSLSGNIFTPITNMKIPQTNHVKTAVRPEIPIDVFTIVFAATAPATPSNIIIKPAK